MCQSIANGGWRCATHEPGNNAVTSWAASFTGVPVNEARRVFMDLKDEGEGTADPTQDEVVEFLTTQEFHVRHADALVPTHRAQILGQLRAALKRAWKSVLPDGETFHAWKNVMSECWTRAKRKMVATVVLGGLTAVALTGCGGANADATQYTAPPVAPTSASAVVTPGPATPKSVASTHQVTVMTADDPQFLKNVIIGAGADKFGGQNASDAYQTAVLFTMNNGVDGPLLAASGPYTDADLAPAKAAMTPKAFADLKAQSVKANAGDEATQATMGATITKDLLMGSPYKYRPGTAPVATNKTFGPASSSVFGKNLSVRFIAKADYKILDDKGKPATAHATRDVTYSMAHVGSKWLIDGWTVNQSPATITPG